MINFLKDLTKDTMIGELPSIIGFNNRQIAKEFNHIFDSSTNSLRISLIAPNGTVSAHWGKFVNLSCDYLYVRNLDTAAGSINLTPDHNSLPNRFNQIENPCHDMISIAGLESGQTLKDVITIIDNDIEYIKDNALLADQLLPRLVSRTI